MERNVLILLFVLVMHQLIITVDTANYGVIPEDENIFSSCESHPERDMTALFDFSNLTYTFNGDTVHIEGSKKVIWNVEKTDRIEVYGSLFKYIRGTWQPTMYSMRRRDYCKVMYAKDEFWYEIWTQHIVPEDRKCLNNRGAYLHHETYDMALKIRNVPGTGLAGRYKVVGYFDAYDKDNKKRPETICFEVKGDFQRIDD